MAEKPAKETEERPEATEEQSATRQMTPVSEIIRERFKGPDGKPLAEEVPAEVLEAAVKPTQELLERTGAGGHIVPVADAYLDALAELSELKGKSKDERAEDKKFDDKLKAAEKRVETRLKALEEEIGTRVDAMDAADLNGRDREEVKKDVLALFRAEADTQIAIREGEQAKNRMQKSGKAPAADEGRSYEAEDVEATDGPPRTPPKPPARPGRRTPAAGR